jgi:hypothetical protein
MSLERLRAFPLHSLGLLLHKDRGFEFESGVCTSHSPEDSRPYLDLRAPGI